MNENKFLEQAERYLNKEMTSEEITEFEQQCQANTELAGMLAEHESFIHKLTAYVEEKKFRNQLSNIHTSLAEQQQIHEPVAGPKTISIWYKYKRVMGVAASIAGITTLLIAGMVSYYSNKENSQTVQELNKKFESTRRTVDELKQQVENESFTKAPDNTPIKSGGTGFLIDGKGLIITNAHVVQGSNSVVVQNSEGRQFRTELFHVNPDIDIAFLKITDEDFETVQNLPYPIKKSGADLGEELFTLGYPREEIVYNEGYMSASTGFNGDTLSFQIGLTANPGNSGGPVFNKNGEVIGIINTRQLKAEGVVFALSSSNIYNIIDNLKEDSTIQRIKLPAGNQLKSLERAQQVKKLKDFVYMVKSY